MFVAAALLLSIFVNLPSIPPFDPDEARYLEVTREMLETGQWDVPTLNYEPRIKKPAPYHWILAGFMSAFGQKAASARLSSLMAALAVLVLVARFAARRTGSWTVAFLCFAMLASSGLFWAMARVAMVDMLLCLSMTATLLLLYAWNENRSRVRWLVWAALSVAAGVNLKGPVALAVPVVVFLLFLVLRGETRTAWRAAPWLRLLGLAAALSLPWYLWVTWQLGEHAFRYFFQDELLGRYFTNEFKRAGNPFYYLGVAPAALLIWTPLVAWAAWDCLVEMKRQGVRAWTQRQPLRAFALAWLVGVVGFFSLGGSKLPHYILPALPAAALLTAEWWARRRPTAPARWWAAPAVAAALALAAWWWLSDAYHRTLPVEPELAALGAIVLGLSLSTFSARRAGGTRFVAAAAACAMLLSSHVLRVVSRDERIYPSEHAFADFLAHWAPPGMPVYSIEQIRPSLLWGLSRRINEIETDRLQDVRAVLSASQPAVLVGSERNFAKLRNKLSAAGLGADAGFWELDFGLRRIVPNAGYRAAVMSATDVPIPRRGSLRLAALGDTGTGYPGQYRLARVLAGLLPPPDAVLLLGDNIYPDVSAGDSRLSAVFEEPYAPLLAAGIPFYAVLGNHDQPTRENQVHYPPFHMNGRRYYTQVFADGLVEVFFLDSTPMKRFQPLPDWNGDPQQAEWFKAALAASRAPWKFVALHHPIYRVATDHAGSERIRASLEPAMQAAGVAALICGHSHVYSLRRPDDGLLQFVMGSSGHLNEGDGLALPGTQGLFDRALALLVLDIDPHEMRFHVVSLTGEIVDHGVVSLPPPTRPHRLAVLPAH
ncbi:metallophosphoesterase [bacterium]|nr:metallophosphoesterase [bacterium]